MSDKIQLTGRLVDIDAFGIMDIVKKGVNTKIELEPIELKRQLSKLSLMVVCSSVAKEQPKEMPEVPDKWKLTQRSPDIEIKEDINQIIVCIKDLQERITKHEQQES